MARACRVRVCIPHFFQDKDPEAAYGSCRPGNRRRRELALARCLSGVMALQRGVREAVLSRADEAIVITPAPTYPSWRLTAITIELHVFVNGSHYLADTLAELGRLWPLQLHRLQLEDPTELALAARDCLLQANPVADLSLYLEDDLVIADPLYLDKQWWFLSSTNHERVLMPHRYELTGRADVPRLFVDGPLTPDQGAAVGAVPIEPLELAGWNGTPLRFEALGNPHAGSFTISGVQQQQLRKRQAPRQGFIGPLETAATLTVCDAYPVYKPAWAQRDFLCLEHGHPVYRAYLDRLPWRD